MIDGKITVQVPPLSDNVKASVMLSLGVILKPIIDKWNGELKSGSIAMMPGLQMARDDLKSLIADAEKRAKGFMDEGKPL